MELRAFISQCVESGVPIIPVLLSGIKDFPRELLFLRELNAVRFGHGIDDSISMDNLEWGITGRYPQKQTSQITSHLTQKLNHATNRRLFAQTPQSRVQFS